MDELDRKLITEIQHGFPLVERPFLALAETFGTTEGDVIERIARLKRERKLFRLGANFDPRKLGYESALVAAVVRPEHFEAVVEAVRRHPGVTHNYEREDRFNMWFTLIEPSFATRARTLDGFASMEGVERIICLPVMELFKLKVDFDLTRDKVANR